jgi:hypothetical protein
MPKGNLIPGLSAIRLADGRWSYHWRPSPRLRKLGWTNLSLGTEYEEAAALARQRNEEVGKAHPGDAGLEAILARPSRAKRPPVTAEEKARRHRIQVLERRKRWCERELALLRAGTLEATVKETFVYFVAARGGPIKIGSSMNPKRRIASLQTTHPRQLRLMVAVPGGAALEREYHRRFAAHRLEGEWFERHPDIMAEITRLRRASREPPQV